jgi:hypothetical protein
MDWNLAIERNKEALKRILAMLIVMIGAAKRDDPDMSAGQRTATLPRHLHRFVLRLLRPAESATRRLIIIAARGLVVELPPLRSHKPKPAPQPRTIFKLDRIGGSIVSVPIVLPQPARSAVPPRRPTVSFSLLDPLKRFGVRPRYVKPSMMPRIRSFDDPRVPLFQQPRRPNPPPPSPDDPLDAARLHRRLEAIERALDDLPRQAKRLARWQASRDAILAQEGNGDAAGMQGEGSNSGCNAAGTQKKDRFHRLEPMRPGRPPGWRRRPSHAVDEVLNELHGLAVRAREHPDSS